MWKVSYLIASGVSADKWQIEASIPHLMTSVRIFFEGITKFNLFCSTLHYYLLTTTFSVGISFLSYFVYILLDLHLCLNITICRTFSDCPYVILSMWSQSESCNLLLILLWIQNSFLLSSSTLVSLIWALATISLTLFSTFITTEEQFFIDNFVHSHTISVPS